MNDFVRFTRDDTQRAGDEWGFNCGPAALAAVLDLRPEEVRPHLGDFEVKGYTNPSLMATILRSLRIPFRRVYEALGPQNGCTQFVFPEPGLVRVQFGGPWTNPGVPVRARYRHTHWVATRYQNGVRQVFDVNAICVGGWLPYEKWAGELIPWLINETKPKASGEWWPTHCWQLDLIVPPGGGPCARVAAGRS